MQFEEEQKPANAWMTTLAYSNGVLSNLYGVSKRPYIHHVPQFMDKRILKQYAEAFAAECEKTMASRFRDDQDMTLAFVYYNFITLSNHSTLPSNMVSKEVLAVVEVIVDKVRVVRCLCH